VFKLQVHKDQEESGRLVRELLASGATRAPATVLSVTRGRVSELTGFAVKHHLLFIACELTIRVEPPGDAPFETTFAQILGGDVVAWLRGKPADFCAIYDPANRERIALDVVTWGEQKTRELDESKRLAAEWQEGGGVEGHLARLQSMMANPAASLPPAPPAPAPPAADPLARLGELRAAGALTEAEFAAEKARLLGL